MDPTQSPTALADEAYEAIRAINHRTMWARLPAPVVYSILGSLKGVGYLLPQALTQLASGLGRSLDEDLVSEDDDRDQLNLWPPRQTTSPAQSNSPRRWARRSSWLKPRSPTRGIERKALPLQPNRP